MCSISNKRGHESRRIWSRDVPTSFVQGFLCSSLVSRPPSCCCCSDITLLQLHTRLSDGTGAQHQCTHRSYSYGVSVPWSFAYNGLVGRGHVILFTRAVCTWTWVTRRKISPSLISVLLVLLAHALIFFDTSLTAGHEGQRSRDLGRPSKLQSPSEIYRSLFRSYSLVSHLTQEKIIAIQNNST